MVMLNKKNAEKINPATEDKQDVMITLLGGLPASEHATIEDLITALAADFAALQVKLTDHSQLTQVVKSDGTPVDFAAQFTALIAKFTDATQKTKIISDAGVVVDLTTQLAAILAKFTDATQKTKIISDAGVVVDLTTQLAAILAKFTDHLQLTQVVKSDGTPVDFAAQFTALIAKFTDATQKTQIINASGTNLYPAGKSAVIEVRLTRPADVVQYTAGDAINSSVATPVSIQLTPFGLENGKGAWITGINVATNLLNLASSTIRIWLYRTTPSMVGDNVAMTNLDANTALGRQYIDVTFGPLLAGSAIILGQVAPMLLMQCDAAHSDIQQTIQTLATFTPVSGGFIDLTYTLLQL